MSTSTQTIKVEVENPSEWVVNLQEIAGTICHDAIEQTRAKFPPKERNLPLSELLPRPEFFERFKYNLARGVANALGTYDPRIKAVYLADPALNPDAETEDELPLDTEVHLLIQVEANSAALESFIASLDQALIQYIDDQASPLVSKVGSMLNTILITQDDITHRRGFAALVSSIYAPPVRIWRR